MNRRWYQEECNSRILERRAAGVMKQLAIAAVGTGKTITFGYLTYEMPKGAQEIVIAHREELIDQAANKIAKVNPGLSIGIDMGDRKADGREDVIVGSVQTLSYNGGARLEKYDPARAAFLIIDEAHHATASTYKTVIDHFMVNPHTTLVGFTATDDRADGVALGNVFDEIVFNYPMLDAIRDGWLVDVHQFQVKTDTDIGKLRTNKEGDFSDKAVTEAVDTYARNELLVLNWLKYIWPRQTVVFTVNVQHAINVAAAFRRQGIKAAAVWGGDPERERKLEDFRTGQLEVICNAQLLIEGFDLWSVEAIVPATPTKSRSKYTQMVGRGTRLQEEIADSGLNMVQYREQGLLREDHKTHCVVMDVLDKLGKHSLASVPSLFGLPPKLNLQGSSASQAARVFKEVGITHPQVDLNDLEEIGNINTYIQKANIWKVRFAEEIKGFSELQWTKRGDGSYRLAMPKNEYFIVREDAVGKFTVEGVLRKNKMQASNVKSLSDAVQMVEKKVVELSPDSLVLLGRQERWMKQAITPDQKRILEQLYVPAEHIAQMNRGQASAYINEKFNKRG